VFRGHNSDKPSTHQLSFPHGTNRSAHSAQTSRSYDAEGRQVIVRLLRRQGPISLPRTHQEAYVSVRSRDSRVVSIDQSCSFPGCFGGRVFLGKGIWRAHRLCPGQTSPYVPAFRRNELNDRKIRGHQHSINPARAGIGLCVHQKRSSREEYGRKPTVQNGAESAEFRIERQNRICS